MWIYHHAIDYTYCNMYIYLYISINTTVSISFLFCLEKKVCGLLVVGNGANEKIIIIKIKEKVNCKNANEKRI